MADVLVTATDLAELMLSPTPPVILDVRWQLGDDDGRQHYRDGHLPGAIYVDLDTEPVSYTHLTLPTTPYV